MAEPPGPDTPARPGNPDHEPAGTPDLASDVEEALQRRKPLRIRALQGLGLLILLVVVISLIGRPLLTVIEQARGVVPTPTPVPLGPVLVLSNVSFGTVTVNGTLLAGPPPLVTRFRQGSNTITLTAPPFRPRTCQVQSPSGQVQWPSGSGQYPPPCGLRQDVTYPYHVGGRSVTPEAVVDLWLGGDDLPADVRTRTLANISATLHAVPLPTTVPAGEYIATGVDARGQITSQQVAAPLHADLLVTPTSLDFGDTFCADLGCATAPTAATVGWAIHAGVSVEWEFTPLSGGQASRSALYPPASSLRLVLTFDPIAGWDLDQQSTEQLNGFGLSLALPATVCPSGADYLRTLDISGTLYVSIVTDHGLAGCELQLVDVGGTGHGSFVWRFGVLLAADAQAHRTFHDLPLAPPSALAAVSV